MVNGQSLSPESNEFLGTLAVVLKDVVRAYLDVAAGGVEDGEGAGREDVGEELRLQLHCLLVGVAVRKKLRHDVLQGAILLPCQIGASGLRSWNQRVKSEERRMKSDDFSFFTFNFSLATPISSIGSCIASFM